MENPGVYPGNDGNELGIRRNRAGGVFFGKSEILEETYMDMGEDTQPPHRQPPKLEEL